MNWTFFLKAAIVGVVIVSVSELIVYLSETLSKSPKPDASAIQAPIIDWKLLVKMAVTVAIIVGVSEVVKRSPSVGALIVALPFTSILVMTWMHIEGAPSQKVAQHSASTFWYVLPTMPMFLVLPKLLEMKWNYYLSLFLCCALTTALFFAMEWVQNRLSPS